MQHFMLKVTTDYRIHQKNPHMGKVCSNIAVPHQVILLLKFGFCPHQHCLSSSPPPPLAEQKHAEGLLEGLVAEGVAHGVDGAVDVAEPVAQVPERQRDAVCAESGDEHHDVVWCPREDEGQEDGTKSLGCLLLLHQDHPLSLGDLVLQGRVHGFGGGGGGGGGSFVKLFSASSAGCCRCWIAVFTLWARFGLIGDALFTVLLLRTGKILIFCIIFRLPILTTLSFALLFEGSLWSFYWNMVLLLFRWGVAVKGSDLVCFRPCVVWLSGRLCGVTLVRWGPGGLTPVSLLSGEMKARVNNSFLWFSPLWCIFCCKPLQLCQIFCPFLCLLVDPTVQDSHNRDWDVERGNGCPKCDHRLS